MIQQIGQKCFLPSSSSFRTYQSSHLERAAHASLHLTDAAKTAFNWLSLLRRYEGPDSTTGGSAVSAQFDVSLLFDVGDASAKSDGVTAAIKSSRQAQKYVQQRLHEAKNKTTWRLPNINVEIGPTETKVGLTNTANENWSWNWSTVLWTCWISLLWSTYFTPRLLLSLAKVKWAESGVLPGAYLAAC